MPRSDYCWPMSGGVGALSRRPPVQDPRAGGIPDAGLVARNSSAAPAAAFVSEQGTEVGNAGATCAVRTQVTPMVGCRSNCSHGRSSGYGGVLRAVRRLVGRSGPSRVAGGLGAGHRVHRCVAGTHRAPVGADWPRWGTTTAPKHQRLPGREIGFGGFQPADSRAQVPLVPDVGETAPGCSQPATGPPDCSAAPTRHC